MDTTILEDIGLTTGEIKVYLALLNLGSSTAGDILKKANVQNSVFHLCINGLMKKGLVSYIRKNNFRLYSASDPENLLGYVKDKEQRLKKILPELKSRSHAVTIKQNVEIFEGIGGIITMLNILISDARKGDEFLMFAAEGESLKSSEEIQNFYKLYDEKRMAKGLIVKGIASSELKNSFQNRKLLKMKYTDMPVPANSGICNDKMVIISWDEKPIGILIKSKGIIEKQRKFFQAYWNSL